MLGTTGRSFHWDSIKSPITAAAVQLKDPHMFTNLIVFFGARGQTNYYMHISIP